MHLQLLDSRLMKLSRMKHSQDIFGKDVYKRQKYVIARTRHDEYQYEGIKVIDIADWLLDK